jgi:hypothetical protein
VDGSDYAPLALGKLAHVAARTQSVTCSPDGPSPRETGSDALIRKRIRPGRSLQSDDSESDIARGDEETRRPDRNR